jgi:signal transduction histidine kinase
MVELAFVILITNDIYMKGYKELENDQVIRNVDRISEALSVRLDALNTFCYDWAAWDDSYRFAQQYNREFVDRNFQAETFNSSKINLILILNSSGKMVVGKAFDLKNSNEITLPDNLTATLSANRLVNPASLDGISGIVLFSGQPMLVASRPILTSTGEGPSDGLVIMGRFLDEEIVNNLSETTHLAVNLFPMVPAGNNPEFDSVVRSLNEAGPIFIKPLNNKTVAGYTFIKDLVGNPVGIFQVDIPRDIYAQGVKTTAVMHASVLFIGLLFCGLFVFLIRKFVLSRVTALNNSVNKIGAEGDATSRVSVSGNDELSRLAENINGMLESLASSEARRRSMKELMSHVLANTLNGIISIDESGNVILANRAFNKLFGLNSVDVTGQNIYKLPALAGLVPEIRAFLTGHSLSHNAEIKCLNNGLNKTFIANFARMNEEALSFLILTDVSEERAKQERLYLTDRLASVGEMASGIAHELNNPLTGILGLSAILAEADMPAEIKEDIAVIRDEAQRAAGIVKNMLSFARKHAPKKEFSQINKIIEDVLKLRRYEHKVTNIIVEKELDPELPEIMVDYFQIQQVFINIILNAEQAMAEKQGKRIIKITTEKVDRVIRVSFTDNGPGIPSHLIGRIFDPFFTTKEVGKGTGLGLSISYGIITAHNGAFYARSENGRGATFIVELPVLSSVVEEILDSVEQYEL